MYPLSVLINAFQIVVHDAVSVRMVGAPVRLEMEGVSTALLKSIKAVSMPVELIVTRARVGSDALNRARHVNHPVKAQDTIMCEMK